MVQVSKRSSGTRRIPDATIRQLRTHVKGQVIVPGDAEYDESRRLWNGMIDKRPAVIVRCRGVADVVQAVNFAREQGLPVTVRGGGHNVSGNAMSAGGLTIDLTEMSAVRVDAAARVVRAEGGARLGDLDRESQAFGLAVPAGVVSDTGVAGLTLGGGMGWMRRKHGLTCDNVVSMDVVTADGRVITVSETENSDLFWALRGGGGGFGVVTAFEYKAYPLGPDVFFTAVFHPHAEARALLRFFREFMAAAPDEVNVLGVFATIPVSEMLPEEVRGQKSLLFAGGYAGPAEEGERVMRPLREAATPLLDLSRVMPYVEAQKFFDEDYPSGRRYYWKSQYLKDLSDGTIEAIVDLGDTYPSPLTTIDVWPLGGAIKNGDGRSAVAHGDAPYLLNFESNWDDPTDDETNVSWTREAWDGMQRFSTGGLYVNFPGFEEGGEAHQRSAYGASWERLKALKAQYDPTDLFRATS